MQRTHEKNRKWHQGHSRHSRRTLCLQRLGERTLLAADLVGVGEEYRPVQAMMGDIEDGDATTGDPSRSASSSLRVSPEGEAVDAALMAMQAEGEAIDFQQDWIQYDVNFDNFITAMDALLVINLLNRTGAGRNAFDIFDAAERGTWEDVSGDGFVTPIDALLVINWLNRNNGPGPVPVPNVPPHAIAGSATTVENVGVNMELEGYDANGDELTFQVNSPPVHGTLTGDAPTLRYEPNADFVGTDSLSFRVHDGTGWSDTATFVITVSAADGDPPPEAQNPSNGPVNVERNDEAIVTLRVTNHEPGFIYQVTSPPVNGELVALQENGPDFRYVPDNGFVGTDGFHWRFHDGESWSQQFEATIIVSAPQPTDASIALADPTPPSENLFVSGAYHVATFDVTGTVSAVTFDVEPVGLEGFASFYLTDAEGNRLSQDIDGAETIVIDLLTSYDGNTLLVWTNTGATPVTYGGALRSVALNGETIDPTQWSNLHRVNA